MKKVLFFLFCSLSHVVFSQKLVLPYPKGSMLFPINPHKLNYLAGGMGDLRHNHFHAGLDIKTQGREGLPVYASDDGYISEMRIQTRGYGHVMYVTHPKTGLITVYGHLKGFAEPMAAYVKQERLKKQTFEISVKPAPNEFPVQKGQLIAYSGNTGGSAGPHLHFEIRDSRNNLLNPLLFGFTEIVDNTPPTFQEISVKPLDPQARVMGDFETHRYSPAKSADGTFSIAGGEILANGWVGIEMMAVDRMNYTHHTNGLNCVEMMVDGQEYYFFHLEQFPDAHSNDINIHLDYPTYKSTGRKMQKLFIDDGNINLPVYKPIANKGKIFVKEGETHQVTLKIWDSNENLSIMHFTLKGQARSTTVPSVIPSNAPTQVSTQVNDNTLVIKAKNLKTPTSTCEIITTNKTDILPIHFVRNNTAIYLWDLRKGIPRTIRIDSTDFSVGIQEAIFSGIEKTFQFSGVNILFPAESLYDTLYLDTKIDKNKIQVSNDLIPLKKPITITFRPSTAIISPDKTAVYNHDRKFLGGTWRNGSVTFKTDILGDFQVLSDTIPPRATLVNKTKDAFSFHVSDNLSGIKSFRATVNGKFVLCDYEYKKSLIWSVKSDSTQTFVGNLALELTDNQGNSKTYTAIIDSLKAPQVVKKASIRATKKNRKK